MSWMRERVGRLEDLRLRNRCIAALLLGTALPALIAPAQAQQRVRRPMPAAVNPSTPAPRSPPLVEPLVQKAVKPPNVSGSQRNAADTERAYIKVRPGPIDHR